MPRRYSDAELAEQMGLSAPTPTSAPDAAPTTVKDYLAPGARAPLGREGQEYAGDLPYRENVKGYKAFGDTYAHLVSTGMDEDAAAAEAARSTAALQAIGHVEDEESVRKGLDAYKGEITPTKAARQIANQFIPLGPPVADDDAEWRERATVYDTLSPSAAFDAVMEKLSGTPMSAAEAKEAGIDKPLVQDIKDASLTAIGAFAMTPATALQGLAEVAGVDLGLPSPEAAVKAYEDVAALPGRIVTNTEYQRAVTPEALSKTAARAVLKTPLPDVIPLALDAGLATHDALTGEDYAGRFKAATGKTLGQAWSGMISDMRAADAFDPAAKHYYETGDESRMLELTDAQIPQNVERTKPDVAILAAAVQPGGTLADDPAAQSFKRLVESGAPAAALQTGADALPLGVVRKAQPEAGPARDSVVEAYRRRVAAMKATGSDEADAITRAVGAALMRPDIVGGEKVFVPSTAQKGMSLINVAQPAITELDVPAGLLPVVGKALTAAGADRVGPMLEEARIPTPAGWDHMVATGAYDDALHAIGLRGSEAPRQRDNKTGITGRILADLAMPEYQTLGFQKGLRAQGVKPGSTADVLAGNVDFAADMFAPWEEVALAPLGKSLSAARRAWVGGREASRLGGSARTAARSALASAVPLAVNAADSTIALDRAVKRGLEADIRAGRRLFSVDGTPGTMSFEVQREIAHQLANGGVDPDTVFRSVNGQAGEWQAANARTVDAWMKRGAPQDVALRESAPYKQLKAQYEAVYSPRDVATAMALNEQAAWQAVGDGTVATPEEWFALQRVEKGGAPGAGAFFNISPSSAPDEVLAELNEVGIIPQGRLAEILGSGRPEYLDTVAKYIVDQRAKLRAGALTKRDVAKAYLLTLSSIQQGERSVASLAERGAKIGIENPVGFLNEARDTVRYGDGPVSVRPEDYAAAWMLSPEGKAVLDHIEAGTISPEDEAAVARVRQIYSSNTFDNAFKVPGKGEFTLRNLDEATTAINADGGDPVALEKTLKRFKGIRDLKAPFIGQLLGLGDVPTLDAVDMNGLLTGKANIRVRPEGAEEARRLAMAQKVKDFGAGKAQDWLIAKWRDSLDRLRSEGHPGAADIPDEAFGAIMHHWFWDKLKGGETKHAGMYDAMRYASSTGPTIHGSIEPEQAKWLIRYFQTADGHTLLHENAHLIRFVLGDKWMDDLVTFFDHDANGLTREGEEQFAEALARVMRGQLAPNGRATAYLSELKDALSDIWRRVRGEPVVLPPGFRAWWDAKLNPAEPLQRMIEVVDARLPRGLDTVTTKVNPDTMEPLDTTKFLKRESVKRAGQVRGYMSVDLTPGQTLHALGLKEGQEAVDAVEIAANAAALVAVAQAQHAWGFTGDLARVGKRSAVPIERKAAVLDRARAEIEKAIGGPIPANPDGTVTLTATQASGLAEHVDHLIESGWAEQLSPTLLAPDKDFGRLTEAEWSDIVRTTVDDVAGPGAYRDRRTEAVAGNLATSLLRAASSALDNVAEFKAMRSALLEKFDNTFQISANLNPAAAEVIERARREFGDIPAKVVRLRAEAKRGLPDANAEEIIRYMADAIPRMGVPPEQIDALVRLHGVLAEEPTIQQMIDGADEVTALFASSPAQNLRQRMEEREALRALKRAKRGAEVPEREIAAAAGVVQAGLTTRMAATEQTGLRILQGFMGKPELKHAIEDRSVYHSVYKAWFEGDWQRASVIVGERGGATDPMSNYDPLSAALAVTTGLLGDAAMAKFGAELIDIGLPIHTNAVNFAGRDFATWVPLGDSTRTGREYQEQVHRYMNTILSFQGTRQKLVDEDGQFLQYKYLPTQLGADGQVHLAAWQDAHRILNAWGVKDGTAKMERLVLPTGEEMWVPDVVQKELSGLFERTAKAGVPWLQAAEGVPEQMLGRFGEVDPVTGRIVPSPDRSYRNAPSPDVAAKMPASTVAGRRLADSVNVAARTLTNGWNTTMGLARVGVTTGVGLPNPAFYIGNGFGGVLQLYQRVGAVGTLRTLGRYLAPTDGGAVLRSVYTRIWGDANGYFKAPSASFVTRDGRVLSDAYVVREAVSAGLHTSQPKAESVIKIVRDIREHEGTFFSRIKRDGLWGGAKESFRYWQGILTDASAAVDDLFRVATFVDELAGGATSAEAAEVSRMASFDYGDLTDFEKAYMRRFIMFYTYQRRNADLFWWTMLNHPSRVMGQFRAIRDAQERVFGDDETAKIVMPDYLDARLVAGINDAVGDEEGVKGMMGIALLLPPVPAADHFSLWVDLFRALNSDSGGRRELLSRLTPEMQMPIVLGLDIDVFSGRDLAAFNTVPSWMVEMDRQLNGGVVVDDLFKVRRTQNRDPATDAVPGEDRWEPTGDGAKWWWVFRNLVQVPPFGRGMDTITQMARGDWIVGGAVNNARWYREAGGLTGAIRDDIMDPIVRGVVRPAMDWLPGVDTSGEPYYEAATPYETTEGPRTGYTPGQERAQLFGVKHVTIPTRDLALDRAQREAEMRAGEKVTEEKRRNPTRYGR